MPFQKHMLLDYEPDKYQALNASGWGYILTVRIVTWWGLRDRIIRYSVQVPSSVNPDSFYKPKLNVWSTSK